MWPHSWWVMAVTCLPPPPIAVVADHMGHSLTEPLVHLSFWMHVWILMAFILFLFFPKCAHPGLNSESLFSSGTHSHEPLGLRKTALVAPCQLCIWRMSKKRWAVSHRGLCDCVRGPRKLANILEPGSNFSEMDQQEKRNYLCLVIVIDNIYGELTMCQAPC